MVEFDIIIPARLDSKRLPGKVLRDICGKTLIERVYECAKNSSAVSVTIATDDVSISKVAQSFGANICMTSSEHKSGTDRVAEAAQLLNLEDEKIVVNLQADEPSIPSELIDQVANLLYITQNNREHRRLSQPRRG
jgi:3-deoxy-manno-octulosonate cytidylyltransferase (CMP-KDO synthetase)